MTAAVKDGVLAGFRAVQYASAGLSFLAALVAWFTLSGRPDKSAPAG